MWHVEFVLPLFRTMPGPVQAFTTCARVPLNLLLQAKVSVTEPISKREVRARVTIEVLVIAFSFHSLTASRSVMPTVGKSC